MLSANRDRRDILDLAGAPAEARHFVASAAVDNVRIERVGRHVAVCNRAEGNPVAKGDLAAVTAARDAHRSAFLLSAADAIWKSRSDAVVIELRGRLVVPGAPRLAVIEGNDRSLIAGEKDVVRIVRTDP